LRGDVQKDLAMKCPTYPPPDFYLRKREKSRERSLYDDDKIT